MHVLKTSGLAILKIKYTFFSRNMRNPNQLFVKCTPFFLKCIAYFIHVNNTLPISPFTTASHVGPIVCNNVARCRPFYHVLRQVLRRPKPCTSRPRTLHLLPFPKFFLSTRHSLYVSTHTRPHTHTHKHTIKVEFRSYSPFLRQSLITFI